MPRGSYQGREAKKPKKSKQKIEPPAQILSRPQEPARVPPKRRSDQREEEEERK